MNDDKPPTKREAFPRAECQLYIADLITVNRVLLERINSIEKEVKRIKYIILGSIIALRVIFPQSLDSIIDLIEKVP